MKKTPLMRKLISAIALIMTIAIGLSACEITLNTPDTPTTATTPPQGTTPADTTPVTTDPVHVHEIVIDAEVLPSCTETGLTEGSHCATCNEILISQRVIPALGHTERSLPPVPATYDSTGLTEGLICTTCEKVLIEQHVLPKLPINHYSITYKDYKNAAIENKYWSYAENEGLATLPQPTADQFVFIGWFTEDGTEIRSIPSGSKQNYVLYAQWMQVEFTVNYNDFLVGIVTPSEVYEKGVGLTSLPKPTADGYEFLGWSETVPTQNYRQSNKPSSKDLTIVNKITTEDAKQFELYAHWVLIDYSITYNDAGQHSNPTQYTVEDSFDLQPPLWDGLIFIEWVDEENKTVTKVEKSVGNLVYTAKWKPKENSVISAQGNNVISAEYDEKLQKYIYIHYLGTIEHIAIEDALEGVNLVYKNTNEPKQITISETTTISEAMASETTKIIGLSYSSNQNIASSFASLSHNSSTTSGELSFGIGLPGNAMLQESLNAKIGIEATNTSEQKNGYEKVDGIGFEETEEYSTTSTLSYTKEFSRTREETWDIPAGMPEGYYSYVYAANVRVYSIIMYDPITKNYYAETYSYVTDIHSIVLYYRNSDDIHRTEIEPLAFNIPVNDLIAETKAACFVQISYDANNSNITEKMNDTAHLKVGNTILPKNEFTHKGYTFIGWNTAADGSGIAYEDEAQIPLEEMNDNLVLYAQWQANSYKVVYNANGGSGTTAESTHTYDVASSLSANGFSRTGWIFEGWSETPNGSATYGNSATVTNLTAEANGTKQLYAVWTLKTSGSLHLSGPYTIAHEAGNSLSISGVINFKANFDIAELSRQGKSFTIKISCTAKVIIQNTGETTTKEEIATIGFFLSASSSNSNLNSAVASQTSATKIHGTTTVSMTGTVSAATVSANPYLTLYFTEDIGVGWDTDAWIATNVTLTISVN